MNEDHPSVVVLAGPNGAGKSTMAARLLVRPFLVSEFVDADVLARTLADLAVARVTDRVRLGGHAVPEETVRRRYRSGMRNFFSLYQALTTTWRMYDNSTGALRLVASGAGTRALAVKDVHLWAHIQAEARRDDE